MSVKPSEYGVREGDTQTALTYLILLAWRDDLMERRKPVVATYLYGHRHPDPTPAAKWYEEYVQLSDEMHFCATLLGDTASDLFNIWEDARVAREYVFNPKGKPVKFRKPRSIEIADAFLKGNK